MAQDSIPNAYSISNQYYDTMGILHWNLKHFKSPIILSFNNNRATIETPNLNNKLELTELLHQRSTSIDDTTIFTWEIRRYDSVLSLLSQEMLEPDIELIVEGDTIKWPLWKSDDYLFFVKKKE